MKSLFAIIIFAITCCIAFAADTPPTEYSAKINVFSNENPIPRKPFCFYLDFGREIDLSSVKLESVEDKGITVPIYIEPIAEYKARIHFLPQTAMEPESELYYVLRFKSGKWNPQPRGDEKLKASLDIKPNLIPNNSFEQTTRTIERFLNWNGRTSLIGWTLEDYAYRYSKLDDPDSTCRVSDKEAYQGKNSLCFKSGQPRMLEQKKVLLSGSAFLQKEIPLKPGTAYKLSFFVKVVEQVDNGMNFQGVGMPLTLRDKNDEMLPGGVITALFSTGTLLQENYINQWIYVQTCDVTPENTVSGKLRIGEKISGTFYVDMLELREVKDCNLPEIIICKITETLVEKSRQPVERADGTPVK